MDRDKQGDKDEAVTWPAHLANLNPRGRACYLLSSIKDYGEDGSAKRFHSTRLANEFATWAPLVMKELIGDIDGLMAELNEMECTLEEERELAKRCTCDLSGDPDSTDPTGVDFEVVLDDLEVAR